jgi:hypothetical protein
MAKRWSSLSSRQRWLIVAAGLTEAVLKVAMLVDLRRRPPDEIRGPKWLWAVSALLNTAGVGSVLYFTLGRRPHREVPAPELSGHPRPS